MKPLLPSLILGTLLIATVGFSSPLFVDGTTNLDCRGMGTYTFYAGASFPAPGQYSYDEIGRIIVGITSPTSTPYATYITPAQLPMYIAQGYVLVASTTQEIATCYDAQNNAYTAVVTAKEASDYRTKSIKPVQTAATATALPADAAALPL